MTLPRFEYLTPNTIQEACSLLSRYRQKAKLIAGGTDLLVKMKEREIRPQYLIGLKGIPNLDYIDYNKAEGLRIGALAPHRSIANSAVIRRRFAFLAEAAASIGTVQIRNMGTIGGNLCNAAPSADTAPPLIAMGAKAKLASPKGERTILLEEFFTGPGETALKAGEILTEIQVPNLASHSGGVYLKLFKRSAVDIAAVGVAALITLDSKKQICSQVRIVLGAVAPTPIRAKKAEKLITGKKIEEGLIEQAAQVASEEAKPISDVRSSAEYRSEMVKVLTKRALRQALERAKRA